MRIKNGDTITGSDIIKYVSICAREKSTAMNELPKRSGNRITKCVVVHWSQEQLCVSAREINEPYNQGGAARRNADEVDLTGAQINK